MFHPIVSWRPVPSAPCPDQAGMCQVPFVHRARSPRESRRGLLQVALLLLTLLASSAAFGQSRPVSVSRSPDAGHAHAALAAYGRIPISFEENRGQTDPQVRYMAHGQGYGFYFTSREAVLALSQSQCAPHSPGKSGVISAGPDPCSDHQATVRLRMVGANPSPVLSGVDLLSGKSNYFIGKDPRQWHTGIPNYAEVEYRDIYPGVDLVYYGNRRQLEFDLVVAPGADPGQLRFKVEGARELALNSDGDLVIHLVGGDISLHKPVVYQESSNGRQAVDGRFVPKGHSEFAFEVGPYDRTRKLVVDPTLVYSTFVGGSVYDGGTAIAVDSAGNAYIGGFTESANFPTASPFQSSGDSFITKMNPGGTALVYSTYFGGTQPATAAPPFPCNTPQCLAGLAVDSAGNAYVTGVTGPGFPTTGQIAGACDTNCQANGGTFVAKIDASGSALDYASLIGGAAGSAIAIDSAGNAYVTGAVWEPADFPAVDAYQPTFGGGGSVGLDAFLLKVNPSGSALVYSTFLGGSGDDQGSGIAVDSSGDVYVAGNTDSPNFPQLNPIAGACVGTCGTGQNQDLFLTEFNAAGSALIYSTLIGGSGNDTTVGTIANLESGTSWGGSLVLDSTGNAYLTGDTEISILTMASNDFPVTPGALQTTSNCSSTVSSCTDGFVTKVNAAGSALVYSTFIGSDPNGANGSFPAGIAVDSAGDAAIVGAFPGLAFVNSLTTPPAQQIPSIAVLNPSGSALLFSTFFQALTTAATFDSSGNLYVTGTACTLFPVTTGAYQTACTSASSSQGNAFISKISLGGSEAAPTVTLSPTSLTFPSQAVGTTSTTKEITVSNSGTATLDISSITVTGTNPGDFTETNTCVSALASTENCTISVTFTPAATGSRSASVSIADNAADSPQSIAISGTGITAAPVVSLAPAMGLSFASQTVGTTSAAQDITLSNTGNAALSITGISVTGADAADFAQTNTCGGSVAAGSSCTIAVTFTPTAAGTLTASISIADNAAGSPQTSTLLGAGTAAATPGVSLLPASLTFASQTVGTTSAAQTVTLTSSGTASLTITGITLTGSNAADFAQTNNCGSSVAAGAHCTISVTFTPAAAGNLTASISVADNAGGSPQTIALSGTGAAAAPPDFAVAASPTTLSVSPGASGTSTLTVTPSNGFSQQVSFACSGLPALASCSFSPSTVTPNGSAATTTLTISTTASTTAQNEVPSTGARPLRWAASFAGLLFFASLGAIRRRRSLLLMMLGAMVLLGTLQGCGGGSGSGNSGSTTNPGTPAGTSTVTITATSGSGSSALSQTATLSLTVQ